LLHLIWDLDGTLIDSEKEILYHLECALRDSSLDISDLIKPIKTGPPLDIMLKESFSTDILTDSKMTEILSYFRKRYDASDFTMTKAYEGIDEIISDIDNFIHHIVTNKPYNASQSIINKLGWSENFSTLKTPSPHIKQRKSKTELFSELIFESNVSTSSFIGIGDMKTDCLAAKENNITSVGVLWGTGTREELFDCCDYIFENSDQLQNFLYKRKIT
jgi:phosphoglycolate phosphatase